MDDVSRQFTSATHGATPRPESEKRRDTPASSEPGEESREELANDSTLTGHQHLGAGELPRNVVRATGRIQIDMALVAEDRAAHLARPKTCGGPERCSACRLAADLSELQRVSALASNVAQRALWRLDSDQLDRYVLEHGSAQGFKWGKYTPADVEHVLSSVSPGLPPALAQVLAEKTCSKGFFSPYNLMTHVMQGWSSGIASALALAVTEAWAKKRFDALIRQTERPPHYQRTLPVPVRASELQVEADAERSRYLVSMPLRAGRGQRVVIPVEPRDRYQRLLLRELAEGAVRCGAAKLEQDRLRPGRWYLRIAYTRVVEPVKTRFTATVHTGILCFAHAMTANGRALAYDGYDIEAFLRQSQRRRKQYQNDSKVSSRHGHGRGRMLAPIEKLEGIADRWRKTKIQTIARRLVRFLEHEQVGHVLLGDYTGIRDGLPERLRGGKPVWDRIQTWPYYEMQQRIIACLEERGITHEMRPTYYISQTCRKCGSVSADYVDLGRRQFRCRACGHQEHVERNASYNLLQGLGTESAKPAAKPAKRKGSMRKAAAKS